jgi:hypothetical protein
MVHNQRLMVPEEGAMGIAQPAIIILHFKIIGLGSRFVPQTSAPAQ